MFSGSLDCFLKTQSKTKGMPQPTWSTGEWEWCPFECKEERTRFDPAPVATVEGADNDIGINHLDDSEYAELDFESRFTWIHDLSFQHQSVHL